MGRLYLAACLALAAAPAAAEPSIADLVRVALSYGEDKTLQPPMAANLGFPGPMEARVLAHPRSRTPDRQEHVLFVIMKDGQPTDLVWGRTKVIEEASGRYVDGVNYRTTLDGKLTACVAASGRVGSVIQQKLNVSADKVREAYLQERGRMFRLSAVLLPKS